LIERKDLSEWESNSEGAMDSIPESVEPPEIGFWQIEVYNSSNEMFYGTICKPRSSAKLCLETLSVLK